MVKRYLEKSMRMNSKVAAAPSEGQQGGGDMQLASSKKQPCKNRQYNNFDIKPRPFWHDDIINYKHALAQCHPEVTLLRVYCNVTVLRV